MIRRSDETWYDSQHGFPMRTISAKIIDNTHLELSQPIAAEPGATIEIAIPDDAEEMRDWRELANRNALTAYADEDSVYDEL
jgi:hypothetical protein